MVLLLIIEEHQILVDGIKSCLENEPGIAIVGHAVNKEEAVNDLAYLKADLVIIGINMSEAYGLETIKCIREKYRSIKILALSVIEDESYLQQVIKAGASGYILKKTGRQELLHAIKRVTEDGGYICSEMAFLMLGKITSSRILGFNNKIAVDLSKREAEVLQFIADGLTNNEIASRLFTSKRTIEIHRKNLIEKTRSKNTATLIKFAIYNGLLSLAHSDID